MVEIDRIEEIAAEQGKSLSFISLKLGKSRGYLKDKKHLNSSIDENMLAQIADILGTTTDYLHGKTDKKEKPGKIAELSERENELLNLFRQLSSQEQDLFLKMFRAKQE